MKVALFGHTGFIGGNVANVLQERNIPFVGVSRTQPLDKLPTDITTTIICSSKLPQKTYDASDIREFVNSNVLGLINILEWAKSRNISRVVYCSTLSMMPKTKGAVDLIDTKSHYPYKISKAAGEHLLQGYCRDNNIEYVILRIASVYGPGMKADVIHTMFQAANSGGAFILNDRNAEADLVQVDDVALAAVESLTVKPSNRVINVSSGDPIKLIALWEIVKELVGNQQTTIEIKGESAVSSNVYPANDLTSLINRPITDLRTGIRDLIKSYR